MYSGDAFRKSLGGIYEGTKSKMTAANLLQGIYSKIQPTVQLNVWFLG